MIAALQTPNIEGEIINIGTCKTWKMQDVLNLIKKETDAQNKEVTLEKSRLRPKDVEMLVTDNKKANKLLGWKPTTTFEEGIQKTIQWYINNHKTWGYEKTRLAVALLMFSLLLVKTPCARIAISKKTMRGFYVIGHENSNFQRKE